MCSPDESFPFSAGAQINRDCTHYCHYRASRVCRRFLLTSSKVWYQPCFAMLLKCVINAGVAVRLYTVTSKYKTSSCSWATCACCFRLDNCTRKAELLAIKADQSSYPHLHPHECIYGEYGVNFQIARVTYCMPELEILIIMQAL